MPEHNFEKQVHTLMDTFHLEPSGEVWTQVQSRIAKRKKRRFIFFVLPLAGLMLAGSMWFIYPSIYRQPVAATNEPVIIEKDNNNSTGGVTILQEQVPVPAQPAAKVTEKLYTQTGKKNRNEGQTLVPHWRELRVLPPGFTESWHPPIDSTSESPVHPDAVPVGPQLAMSPPFNNEVPVLLTARDTPLPVLQANSFDDTAVALPALFARNKKIQWNVMATTGISKTGSGHFTNVFSEEKAAANPLPNTGGTGVPTVVQKPKNGTSFSVGIAAQKSLSPRSTILAGIQYLYASDQIRAGIYRDTVLPLQNSFSNRLNGYYAGNSRWYTNRYHFIELPVYYQYTAARYRKVPVHLQAGIIYSRLLATNGLLYDPAFMGIYYHQQEQFNRSVFGLGAGMAFQLINTKKISASMGPHFRSSITPVHRSAADPNKFLSAGALRLQILFH